jgi:ribosome biogenesis GTPase
MKEREIVVQMGKRITLEDLGWNEKFAAEFAQYEAQGWKPARLIRDNKITYGALLDDGEELEVTMSGKIYHDAATDAEQADRHDDQMSA